MDSATREHINTLLIQLRDGDETALEQLYFCVGARMLSVAKSYVRDKNLAEDIVQDSFLRIYQGIKKMRNVDNGYAWICTVVRNCAFTALKRENKRATVDIDALFDLHTDDADPQDRAVLKEALASLPARDKEIIWYRYYQDMTIREIAKEMDLPRSTVAGQLERAEEKLRSFYKR